MGVWRHQPRRPRRTGHEASGRVLGRQGGSGGATQHQRRPMRQERWFCLQRGRVGLVRRPMRQERWFGLRGGLVRRPMRQGRWFCLRGGQADLARRPTRQGRWFCRGRVTRHGRWSCRLRRQHHRFFQRGRGNRIHKRAAPLAGAAHTPRNTTAALPVWRQGAVAPARAEHRRTVDVGDARERRVGGVSSAGHLAAREEAPRRGLHPSCRLLAS
jgi:hypothetical protein